MTDKIRGPHPLLSDDRFLESLLSRFGTTTAPVLESIM